MQDGGLLVLATIPPGWKNCSKMWIIPSCRLEWRFPRPQQSPTFWRPAWGTCWMRRHLGPWLYWNHLKSPSLTFLQALRFGRGLYNSVTPHSCLSFCLILSVWFCTQSSCSCPFFFQSEVKVPDFPASEAKGSHMVPFTSTIFIEQSDFREVRITDIPTIKKNS